MPILTYDGIPFDPLDPSPYDVSFSDIAHGLSNTCRFAGQGKNFYSVAEHSVILSYLVHENDAIPALFHDSAEAYICDLPTDLKHSPALAGYRQIEKGVLKAIWDAFGLDPALDPVRLKELDRALGRWEGYHLLTGPPMWTLSTDAWAERAVPWSGGLFRWLTPGYAELAWLHRYYELTD